MGKNIKYVVTVFLSFIFLFTFTTKAEANTPASILTQNLSYGSAGADVTALQNFLISKGYDLTGYTPGTFDWETQTELAKYQATKGISTTGNFGPLTRAAVVADVGAGTIPTPSSAGSSPSSGASSIFTQNLTVGSAGSDVTALQNFLIWKGFDLTGYTSGTFDYETQSELAKYQATKGISSTGNFGPLTRAAVIAEIGSGTIPTPTATSGSSSSTPVSSGSSVFTKNLSYGSAGSDVTALQNFLIYKGYSLTGYTSGTFDYETQSAVSQYQASKGISSTGNFGPLTRAAVIADIGTTVIPTPSSTATTNSNTSTTGNSSIFTKNLSYGSTGADVTALQNFLIWKGYSLNGYTSGSYEYETQSALAQYQISKGISSTGNFGPLTRAAVIADVGTGTIPTPTATAGGSSAPATSLFATNLSYGATGNDVTALQNFLLSKGYSITGYTSGLYDYPTQRDLARYQNSKGISATGNLGPLTRAAILADGGASVSASSNSQVTSTVSNSATSASSNVNSASPSFGATVFKRDLTNYSSGNDVAVLQNFLISKGYIPSGYIQGYFGDETSSALSRYQASNGILSSGNFGPLTRAAVISDIGSNTIQSIYTWNVPSNTNNEDWGQIDCPSPKSNIADSIGSGGSLVPGSTHQGNRLLKCFLRWKGFYTGVYSNIYFGDKTKLALQQYQATKGLSQTGSLYDGTTINSIKQDLRELSQNFISNSEFSAYVSGNSAY